MAGRKGMKPRARVFDDNTLERMRALIVNSRIAQRLVSHVEGKTEMTQSQITAAVALLRKVMPDLQASELTVKSGSYADDLMVIADRMRGALPAPSAHEITHDGEYVNVINGP